MEMKANSTFSKTSALEPHHQMPFSVLSRTLVGEGPIPSAVIQSAYFIPSTDEAVFVMKLRL